VAQEPQRYFTRREIEKLFYRAGFTVAAKQAVPGPGYDAWYQEGRRGEVRAGPLQIGSLPPGEAEEFYTSHYAIRAVPTPPMEYGLTSIIIVTHNQLAFTRQCIESIHRYTDEPYELIVVDNASSDGTLDYLRGLDGITVLANAENRGFPAAANQGLRAATGQQLLLLNNDTIVTTGWLTRLLRALRSDRKIGLVGPCSNCVSGEQQVPARYEDLAGLDGFAWDWGQTHDGQRQDTDRLVGFCLLLKREVLDQIGLLDERFGLGCFEDDDYCLRALRAGYRLAITRDAFIHHAGGQTFRTNGVDYAALMRQNQERFCAKWADADRPATSGPAAPRETVGHAASQPAVPTPAPLPPPLFTVKAEPGGGLRLVRQVIHLSLCMIVRDNARTLGACLESIKPWVDEMVVVDTGSLDDTPAIAARLGARVFHFPWCDSFSAARNESLRHARGRWLFWMDSDDTISSENGRKLRELVLRDGDPSVLGYVMQVHCPGPGEEGETDLTVVDHVKLFRNRPDLRFDRRIHEQIIPAIRRAGGQIAWSDVFVVHSGSDHSPEGKERKLQRDFHLLHLELQEEPDHPFTLFNLGMTYADAGQYEAAVDYLRRSIARSGDGESHLRKAYALLVGALGQLKRWEGAWEACQEGLQKFPQDAELRFRKGVLLHERGRLPAAVETYLDLLQHQEERHFTSVVRGITGHLARHNLAVVYTDAGQFDQAEAQWRRIVQEVPCYRAGWRGLGDLLLRQGKRDEAQALAEQLLNGPGRLRSEGKALRGHLAAAQGDRQAARREFEEATKEFPDDADTWEALCRFLCDHAGPAEAAAALQELTRCDPRNAAAYHNLGVTYSRLGRHPEAVVAYQKSLQLRPAAAETHWQLGIALREVGRLDEAAAAWEQVLRLEPDHGGARAALRQVTQGPRPTERTVTSETEGATETTYRLPLRGRTAEVPFLTRGPVDRAIVRDLWERDAYGVRDLAEPPATVVDIGAHIGSFSLLAAEAWPEARVIACEADPDNVILLQKNLAGRSQVETVAAAVVGEDVAEIEFHTVLDKIGSNSGGSSCVRAEPGSVKTRVRALSVIKLWESKGLTGCDLMKLDCEGSEVPVLRALAESGHLAGVRRIVGEWHAPEYSPQSGDRVREELTALLGPTHAVEFRQPIRGNEGHFTARLRR
jgi:FkbM family methyltransferase